MKYVPALDGLRALACMAVVLLHTHVPGFGGGGIGVDVFFVLSGYLITRLLEGKPDLARFYKRRAARLIPPLALMLAAYLIVSPLLDPGGPALRDAAIAFFYLSDFTYPTLGIPATLGHTWTLSIEEHFYLLWPLAFLRWRPGWTILALVYELLTLWRWHLGDYLAVSQHRIDAHCAGLILGCLLARLPASKRGAEPAWPGLLVLGVAVVCKPLVDNYIWQTAGLTLVEVAAAVAIFGKHPRWLSHPSIVYVGRLSYGIYLWHYPIARLLPKLGVSNWPGLTLATLALSGLLAAVSYHTIEAWSRRLFRARRPAGPRQPEPAIAARETS